MAEFTGERVVPGAVVDDLWNEHVSRYAFAARLARRKRVLDTGCGTGYGAAELARVAAEVTALDLSPEALEYACEHYRLPNLRVVRASCISTPFRDRAFDLVVALEIIEHLENWPVFLGEIRRLLAPRGQAVISTPNSSYYAASRGEEGPNPFHKHEFTFEEFRKALTREFPHVSFFLQNHVEALVFHPLQASSGAEAQLERGVAGPDDSNFFVAVCALTPQTGAPTFLHIPSAANILRERELHIEKLSGEVARKNKWIAEHEAQHQKLLDMFRTQTSELEERNQWAAQLNEQLAEAAGVVRKLEQELESQRTGYEAKVAELEQDLRSKADWAARLNEDLAGRVAELSKCVDVLHETERTLEERTRWALELQRQVEVLQASVARFRASRWVRLGQTFRLGPEERED